MKIAKNIKMALTTATILLTVGVLTGCESEADIASRNLSVAADAFEVERRIVFYNGITDSYMLTIEGRCSIESDNEDLQLEVTCEVAEGTFKKHFLGLSDNVTYFVEHLNPTSASKYRYRVIFRPTTVVPDVEIDLGQ
jgi:hypothetical protein